MNFMTWYQGLAKPGWTPSPPIIGMIWNILYPIILITFGYVFLQAARRRIPPRVALPFGINLVANLIFTPIFFGLRNLPLASMDILVVWATLVWMIVSVWNHARWVALAQFPYLVWVSIATYLQLAITWLNWQHGDAVG
ncbi:MAG: TspO/MBR family protein [Isosphaeraceae bacterium]